MTTQHAIVTLNRAESVSGILRKYAILVNNKKVDSIGSGEGKTIQLTPGTHEFVVEMDFYKSKPLNLTLQAGDMVSLVCGDRGPSTLKESYSLTGLGKLASSILKPGDHLYISRADGEDLVEQKVDQPAAGNNPPAAHAPRQPTEKTRGKIFLSYRRQDSGIITGRISDRLFAHYGEKNVFRDVDSIPLGVDFRDHIRSTMGKCQTVLAIIGPDWLQITGQENERRIDEREDPVRIEIELAFENDIALVPVLVKGASMPGSEQLPDSISKLSFLNAFVVPEDPYFHMGIDKLLDDLDGLSADYDTAGKAGLMDGQQVEQGSGQEKELAKTRFCTQCGRDVDPRYKFCISCGTEYQTL